MKYSWCLLASCAIPLVIEVLVGGEVLTPVPWNVIGLIVMHVMVESRETLVLVVVYSLIAFLMYLQPAVACILPASARDWLESCEKGGLVEECKRQVDTFNRLKKSQELCPHAVLGDSLGTAYTLLAFLFRFVPCCLVSGFRLWQEEAKHGPTLPKKWFVLSCAVVMCCVLEISIVNVKRLSSLEVILPFVFAYLSYSSKHLVKRAFNLGIFYTGADFLMNSWATVNKCSGNDLDPINCRSVRSCLQGINDLYHVRPEDCPGVNLATSVLYLASVTKVMLLTAGITLTGNPLEEQSDNESDVSLQRNRQEKVAIEDKTSTLPTKP